MTKKLRRIILFLGYSSIILSHSACNRPFDSDKPDTRNNHFHYEKLVGVEITPDVKNLYSFGDEIGIDASYYLAFECNITTAKRILTSNSLIKDTKKGNPLSNGFKQKWWNESEIDTLTRYVFTNDARTYFRYFWYNKTNQHAYFLDFDL